MPVLSTLYDKFIRRATLTTQDKTDILGDINGQPLDSDLTAYANAADAAARRALLSLGTAATRDVGTSQGQILLLGNQGGISLTGGSAFIGTTGSGAYIATTGTNAAIVTSGASAYISTSGVDAPIFTQGDTANIFTSGENAYIQTRATFKLFNGTSTTTLSHTPTANRAAVIGDAGGHIPVVPAYADLTAANAALAAGDYWWDTTLKKLRIATV